MSCSSILKDKKDVRVLETGPQNQKNYIDYDLKKVPGGLLIQTIDDGKINKSDLKIVTDRIPNETEITDLLFAWRVGKYVKSNAILFCKNKMTIGMG